MANRNNPHGFKARFHTTGGEIRPVQVKLVAANAEIFPGDVLEQADTGEYDIGEAADVIGAVSAEYSAASSGASILAYIDPYIAFSAQCDDGTGTASAQTCVGCRWFGGRPTPEPQLLQYSPPRPSRPVSLCFNHRPARYHR